jgi:hypothetical protein
MKLIPSEASKFEAECFELTRTLNEYDKIYNQGRNQISYDLLYTEIDTTSFSTYAGNSCRASKAIPDQRTIKTVLRLSKKNYLKEDTIIIARYECLKRHNLYFPIGMELPNLCLKIRNGKLETAFYSNSLTHIIKKQRYHIQILN